MSLKKDILILTSEFPPQPGGIGNHAYNLARQLSLNGLTVSVLTDNRSKSGIEEYAFDAGCDFYIQRIKVTSPRFFMYFVRVIKALKLIKKHKVLLVSGKFPVWMGAFLSFFFTGKKIAVVHGTEVNFKNSWLKNSVDLALNKYNTIIAVSHYTKSLLTAGNQLKCSVIPNGFDPTKFDAASKSGIHLPGSPKLITVGNVTHRKGQLNVIRQLPELSKVFPGLHYHMVGLPTFKDEFLKEAKQLQVADKITFHGAMPDSELKACLLQSSIFVMLSSETATGDIEGFGIAVLEANYLGVPAIGSKNCGIEDAILEGKSGYLVEYNDTDAFINAIKNIQANKQKYKEEAKKWGNKHRWENVIQTYLKEVSI